MGLAHSDVDMTGNPDALADCTICLLLEFHWRFLYAKAHQLACCAMPELRMSTDQAKLPDDIDNMRDSCVGGEVTNFLPGTVVFRYIQSRQYFD